MNKDYLDFERRTNKQSQLLKNLKENRKLLETLLEKINKEFNYDDLVYRFYHSSFKVFYIQDLTVEIYNTLKKLAPRNITINTDFQIIFNEGTNKKFKSTMNQNWLKHTRPILEAFFHAKYFLEMAIKSSRMNGKYIALPSYWAGLLYFYNLR